MTDPSLERALVTRCQRSEMAAHHLPSWVTQGPWPLPGAPLHAPCGRPAATW